MTKKTKRITFDESCDEPEDSEFLHKYSKCTKSSWFTLIFLMACLPTYCRDLLSICSSTSHDLEITCLIPRLITKMHWNISSLRNLTMPNKGRVCSYLDYNYSLFENMEPEEAFIVKDQLDQPSVKKCAIEVTMGYQSFRNYTPTLLKSCSGFDFRNEAKRYKDLFGGISCIVCGILGDIFGRKIVFIVCLFIFIIGMLSAPQASSFYLLITGFSVESIGISGIILMNYIIFAELCNKNVRGILMLYITLFGTVAKLSGFMVKSHTLSYEQACYLFAIPTCSMILYIFMVPESPRWLLSYGKKQRAWDILKNWGEDVSHYVFLPEIKLNKFGILASNFTLLFGVRKYRRTVIVMAWIKFVKTLMITNLRRYVKVHNISSTAHKFLLLMAEIFSFFSILPPFILFGRYITLLCMLLSGLICLTISMFIQTDAVSYLMNILSAQYFYALDYIIILYSLELLPTSARGSGFGIIWGVGEVLSVCGRYSITKWVIGGVMGNIEYYVMIGGQSSALLLMILLPNIRVGELPDWKRYRNIIRY